MTFLAPSILWGLLAAGLPIIIHLLSLQRTRQVDFSTLRFMKRLEHETIRRLRIKQWLLVILRVLIIICLVLVFARPVRHGFVPGWMAGELESRVLIFLDNSASMTLRGEQGTLLEEAKLVLPQIVNSFEGQTTFEVYQTNPPKRVYRGNGKDASFSGLVENIRQTVSKDDFWSVVDSVLTALTVQEPNRECVLISDFQSLPNPESFLASLGADSTAPEWRFYCIAQDPVQDNLAVRDVDVVSKIRMPDHLLKLNARVHNNGSMEKRNVPIELFLNNNRVGQVVAQFQPGRIRDYIFQAYPGQGGGIVRGVVRIPDDDFDLDNQWTFEVSVPERINCTLVGSSRDELFLLATALGSIGTESRFLNLDVRIQPEPNRLYLDDTDVLVIHDPGPMSNEAIDDINSFLERGGGMIWFAGQRTASQKDSRLESVLNLPRPQGITKLEEDAFFEVIASDENHPVLLDLDLRDLSQELPQVFSHVRVDPKNDHVSVLHLSDGDPLLLDCTSMGGAVYYFTVPMDLQWNDLPMRGIMVPLLHRLLLLLATDESNTQPLQVDAVKTVKLDRHNINSQWELITPSGRTVLLIPDFNSETLVIRDTDELGSYQVLSDGNLFTAFSTRLAKQEDPSKRVSEEDILASLPRDEARWILASPDLAQDLSGIRHGRSLWRNFLILAIGLLLLETILGKTEPKEVKRRSG